MKEIHKQRGDGRLIASTPSLWVPIWLTMTASLASLIVILWFDFQAEKIEQEKFVQSAKLLAIGIASSIENSVILRDYAEIESKLKLALSDEHVTSAAVTDDRNHVLSYVERVGDSASSSTFTTRTIPAPSNLPFFQQTDDQATFWTAIGSPRTVGYLRFEFKRTRADLSLRSLRKDVITLSMAGALIMIGLLSVLMKRLRDLFKSREENLIALQTELMDVAYYDSLTGLPNRRLFREFLTREKVRCERSGQMFAVVFCDLDGFKEVNDLLGHDAGDQLLVAFARHLAKSLRQADTVSRFGGDEFVLLLRDIDSKSKCKEVMDRVMQIPEETTFINGHNTGCTLSAGIAMYPTDSTTERGLLGYADKAMYASKKTRENTYTFHSSDEEKMVGRA